MNEDAFTRQRPRDFDGTSSAEIAVFEATEALLGETSLQDLTVAQILDRGGLSRANFYHYFANKHQVLVAMVSKMFSEIYGQDAPWDSSPGRGRARTMGTSLEQTLLLWSQRGPVICAVVEHMHGEPAVARAWQPTYRRFHAAVAEQIEHERELGRAPFGASAATIAAMLICGVERTLYVASRGLDKRLPTPRDVVDSLVAINEAAIYGGRSATNVSVVDERVAQEGVVLPPVVETVDQSDTAQNILDAMSDLLLSNSLAQLSVAKILERASVSRASFYFYFRSRDAAFGALFSVAAAKIVNKLAEVVRIGRDDPAAMAINLRAWLDLDELTTAVIRNAVHEWTRRPELREHYLAAIEKMTSILESVITVDRALGIAPDGPEAARYAATLVWMIERTVAGSLAGEEHLGDFEGIKAMLAQIVHAAIYGRR